jgi:hypothetical protein
MSWNAWNAIFGVQKKHLLQSDEVLDFSGNGIKAFQAFQAFQAV